MHRRQQEAGFKSDRIAHGRKEWDHSSDDQHQMEAREHARLPAKAHKTYDARDAEAQRQIRDLRARY